MNQADDANAGSQLAAMRRPKTRECPRCGNQFVTIGRGVYCSTTCQNRASYLRRKARRSTKGS
jgi:tRNA(Ile2) C34 agmatinyltransferase TiaS